jgi:hypothetical protein
MNSILMAQALALSISAVRTMHAYGLITGAELGRASACVARAQLEPTPDSINAAWLAIGVVNSIASNEMAERRVQWVAH